MHQKDTINSKLQELAEHLAYELELNSIQTKELFTKGLLIDGIAISFERRGSDLFIFNEVAKDANLVSINTLKDLLSSFWPNPLPEILSIDSNRNCLLLWRKIPIKHTLADDFSDCFEAFLNSAEFCNSVISSELQSPFLDKLEQV